MVKTRKKTAKIFTVILSILLCAMIVSVLFVAYCNASGKVAHIGKYAFLHILTGSMEPTIPRGSYILVEKVKDTNTLSVGDVIVFYSREKAIYGKMNTHRIVEVIDSEGGPAFVTKGDNNPIKDELVTKSADVTDIYVKNLPALSKLAGFFNNKIVFVFTKANKRNSCTRIGLS